LLAAPAPAQKRLLVLGDSITAGYGVEGADQSCGYAAATSNQQLTYAALATKALGADLHAIAWSGIGAYRSYAEKTPANPTILTRYQRTLADDADSRWQVGQYRPDAVVIAIGTNDYWEGSVSDDYRLAMQALITQMQTDYPAKPIYLMVSPMLNGAARASQTAVLNSLAGKLVTVVDLGKIEASDGFGCDYHPNIVTHQRMAQALQQRLKDDLNW
jgi:lysophospholipase L1-like esterase